MTCQDIPELLSASLDGELTRDEQAQLDVHLNTCPACRALYEELAGLHAADWGPEVPPELADRILNNLPAQRSGKVIYWKRWGAMAAAITLVALAAWRLPLRPPTDLGMTADSGDTSGAVSTDQAADVTEAAVPEDADEVPMLASAMDKSLPVEDAALPVPPTEAGESRSAKMAAAGGGETRRAKIAATGSGGAQVNDAGAQNTAADTPAQAPAPQPIPSPVDDGPAVLFSMPLPSSTSDVVLGGSQDGGTEPEPGAVGAAPAVRAAMIPEAGAGEDETIPVDGSETPESLPPMAKNEVTMSAVPFEDLTEDLRDFSSYRYVLTLSQADGLEDYPHQLQSGGEMWYLLPLETVEALPQTLAETDPRYALRDTGDDLTVDSPYALVVVPPAP